jgi:hypothetical protein
MSKIFRFHEHHLEQLYLIKLRHGKSPQLARYEVEMLRRYLKKYGKTSPGNAFKYGKDAYLDYDEDGVMNAFDCQPLNHWKMDTAHFYDHRDFSTSFNMGTDTSKYEVVTKYMTADEYLDLARQASTGSFLDEGKTNEEFEKEVLRQDAIEKYAKAFKKGDKFPTPFLVYRGPNATKPSSHEGRHRAAAFKRAFGAKKKLPVYIVRDKSEF